MKMIRTLIIYILLFLLAVPAFATSLTAPSNIPAAYYGTVKYQSGQSVATGTVEAWVSGQIVSSIAIENGNFGGFGGFDPKLTVSAERGRVIEFKVDGKSTSKTVSFTSGDIRQINLLIEGSPPVDDNQGNPSSGESGGAAGGAVSGGGGGGGGAVTPPESQPLVNPVQEQQISNEDAQQALAEIIRQNPGNPAQAARELTNTLENLVKSGINIETSQKAEQIAKSIIREAGRLGTESLIQDVTGAFTVDSEALLNHSRAALEAAAIVNNGLNAAGVLSLESQLTVPINSTQAVIITDGLGNAKEVQRVELVIPAKDLKTISANAQGISENIVLETPIASLTLRSEGMSFLTGATDEEQVTFTMQEAPFSAASQALINSGTTNGGTLLPASRVIDFEIRVGDKKIGAVSIALPFNGADNPMIVRINDDGTITPIMSSRLASSGLVEANLKSTSKYMVVDYNKTFNDIDGHWAENDIEIMTGRFIASGTTEKTFAPEEKITRAQFAALLARTLGLSQDNKAKATFSDVAKSAWYYNSVEAAYKAGLLSGVGQGKFAPEARISRQEMAVMIAKALKLAGQKVDSSQNSAKASLSGFSDANRIAGWAVSGAAASIKAGILSGRTAGSFAPEDLATRAESVSILKRYLVSLGILSD